MLTKKIIIKNRYGLHARAASAFVKASGKYRSNITIRKDGMMANGKSILGILTLAAPLGSTITLDIDGDDAMQALEELGALIEAGFGIGD